MEGGEQEEGLPVASYRPHPAQWHRQGAGTGMEARKPLSWGASRGPAICDPVTLIPVTSAAPPVREALSSKLPGPLGEQRKLLFLPAAVAYPQPGLRAAE